MGILSNLRRGVIPILFVSLQVSAQQSGPNYDLPLDRQYTLRLPEPYALESDRHRQISADSRMGFTYPRPCREKLEDGIWCRDSFRLRYADSGQAIGGESVLGGEFRQFGGGTFGGEGGAVVAGFKGPVSFYLDARIFSESSGSTAEGSYDREDLDTQSESATGTVSYASYARFRGNISLDLPFGRFSGSRDALHWGPGQFGNLVFHQDAVPFYHYSFRTSLGPITVTSVYGDLAIDDNHLSERNLEHRSLYARRYEWNAGGNLLLGLSEQLILYNEDKPYLFIPVFPLFMAKGFMVEQINNGNLGFDAAYRLPGVGLFYTEFLLDDLESPSSLLTRDYAQNKWGWMAGAHLIRDFSSAKFGLVLEYSRVEPYVYTHFKPYTAQSAHLGYPLGNQAGPNSQSVDGKAYCRFESAGGLRWYGAFKASVLWKSEDAGSAINDSPPDHLTKKHFLSGVSGPAVTIAPFVSASWSVFHAEAQLAIGEEKSSYVRIELRI
jgi:hypothetical protein